MRYVCIIFSAMSLTCCLPETSGQQDPASRTASNDTSTDSSTRDEMSAGTNSIVGQQSGAGMMTDFVTGTSMVAGTSATDTSDADREGRRSPSFRRHVPSAGYVIARAKNATWTAIKAVATCDVVQTPLNVAAPAVQTAATASVANAHTVTWAVMLDNANSIANQAQRVSIPVMPTNATRPAPPVQTALLHAMPIAVPSTAPRQSLAA